MTGIRRRPLFVLLAAVCSPMVIGAASAHAGETHTTPTLDGVGVVMLLTAVAVTGAVYWLINRTGRPEIGRGRSGGHEAQTFDQPSSGSTYQIARVRNDPKQSSKLEIAVPD